MSFLSALFYDKCMKATEDACLIDWRKDLLKDINGSILEIGAGTGASLELYPKTDGLHITLSEPDKNMRAQLEEKITSKKLSNVSVLPCPSESISSDDNSYDYVFASLVCCSVNDVNASLKEIKRVLKPDGKFIFLEHVAAESGSNRRKWQNRLNPFWKRLAGNCHLNRETENLIKAAGFVLEDVKRESMRKAMSLVRPTIRGIARMS
ncbi:class I SAM-dependent methyltransferase [Oceaniserpentilla sp. 4NH20-0058]|uniref:class I SAM-dependent methyltransferase n=1 Tax=Oceaniserpentilla sp. 4NH20-0058 TaxID=3127660 RepID=UPI0031035C0C